MSYIVISPNTVTGLTLCIDFLRSKDTNSKGQSLILLHEIFPMEVKSALATLPYLLWHSMQVN